MKLEVGMYCRYNNFQNKIKIAKIKIIQKADEVFQYDYINFDNDDGELETNIIKASYNIIDLIEEKDLLEIEYFSLRYEKRVTRIFEVTYKEGRFINLDNAKCQFMLIDNDWTDNDKELEPIIKSIVTHEQMEQMAYKVDE